MLKNIFAATGFVTLVLYLLGSVGVGNFVYIYTPLTVKCEKTS
jgi:hypothetical protein